MPGKWSKLKGKIPKFEIDSSWQEKVDESKKAYIGLDSTELTREFARRRAMKKTLEGHISLENTELEAISQILINDLEGSEIQKIGLTTGETGYIQDEPYSSVEDKKKLMAWVKKKKLQDLLTLNWQTLNGMVKNLLVDGKPAPPGVKVSMKTSFRLRGGSSNEDEE
jgi:hypothetical protein